MLPNQAMCDMFGYTAEELSQLQMEWPHLPGRLREISAIDPVRGRRKKQSGTHYKTYLRKDGSFFGQKPMFSQYTNPENQTSHHLTTIVDLSLQVEHEQEADKWNKPLQPLLTPAMIRFSWKRKLPLYSLSMNRRQSTRIQQRGVLF